MLTELVGKQLGPYHIKAKIGEGGMAVVFRAYQPSLDRDVAVKVLPPSYAQDQIFIKRFRQEAHSIARLHHPHILPVYDFGVDKGYTYIAMRYVSDGRTLTRLMRQSPSQSQAIELVSQIGQALAYAHKQGVIHRDVKPGNILIDEENQALLADFGLAKITKTNLNLTSRNMSMGTPAYMAPEQFQDQPIDHRADIYALGIILYQILTHTIPHYADTPLTIMLKRSSQPPPPPRTLNPEISESVEQVILQALAIQPERRYGSATDFVTALQKAAGDETYREPIIEDEPTIASIHTPLDQPKSPGEKTWLTSLVRRPVLIVLAVALITIIVGSIWGWLRTSGSELQASEPEAPVVIAQETVTPASTPTPKPTRTPDPTATITITPTSTHTPQPSTRTPTRTVTPSATPTLKSATHTATPVPTATAVATFTPTSTPPLPALAELGAPAPELLEYTGEDLLWKWEERGIPEGTDWYFDIKFFKNFSVVDPYHVIVAEHKSIQNIDGIWNFVLDTSSLNCDSYWAVQIAWRNSNGDYAGSLSPESKRLPIGPNSCGGSGGGGGSTGGNSNSGGID